MNPASRPAADLTGKLLWLEAMRAFAALWVLLHHAELSISNFFGAMGPAWLVLANGNLGVDFFFVLSGFIIAMSCERLASQGLGIREYLRARFLRIYVPYLPVGLLLYWLFLAVPSIAEGREVPGLLASLFLLPSPHPPALSVAWSLVHELLFYLLFTFYFVSRRLLVGLCIAWAGAIAWVWLAGVEPGGMAGYLLYPINLCFLLGALAYRCTRRGLLSDAGMPLLALGLALVGSQVFAADPSRVITAIGFAALVLAAASRTLVQVPPARMLVTLGAASYAIYLVHNPALSAVVRLVKWVDPGLAAPWALLLVSVAALSAGLLYYGLYERPALQWLRVRRARAPVASARAAPRRPASLQPAPVRREPDIRDFR